RSRAASATRSSPNTGRSMTVGSWSCRSGSTPTRPPPVSGTSPRSYVTKASRCSPGKTPKRPPCSATWQPDPDLEPNAPPGVTRRACTGRGLGGLEAGDDAPGGDGADGGGPASVGGVVADGPGGLFVEVELFGGEVAVEPRPMRSPTITRADVNSRSD